MSVWLIPLVGLLVVLVCSQRRRDRETMARMLRREPTTPPPMTRPK